MNTAGNLPEENNEKSLRRSPVGRHLPTSGGLSGTLEKAEAQGCEALQIFVSNPQGWAEAAPRPDAWEFRSGVRRLGISPVVVHAKYLINLAATDVSQYERSVRTLASEMLAAGALGAEIVVVHSGSHGNDTPENGEERLVRGLSDAREAAELGVEEAREAFGYGDLVPAEAVVENSCGAGTQLLSDLDSLSRVLRRADARCCLDTAHAFVAGHDISQPESAGEFAASVREKLEERVAVIHFNDARNELGSHRDGHARIGEGQVPVETWTEFLGGVRGVPVVMETPYDTPEVDAEQVGLAKKLAGGLRLERGRI
ncbi:deoxyribonuclease IV [Rubrobacter indicoceani]|uniref:deoxyribonuclease IV n=1 Tax=Rubrobacter indicoceani TaxID=2051957 RepID=UPI0013C483A5|nr:deoxyribonuclease IV [Rubrobacter indicoceani]